MILSLFLYLINVHILRDDMSRPRSSFKVKGQISIVVEPIEIEKHILTDDMSRLISLFKVRCHIYGQLAITFQQGFYDRHVGRGHSSVLQTHTLLVSK